MASVTHPCLRCGACCHHLRVAFLWTEAEDATPGGVPLARCEEYDEVLRCMRGTRSAGRCCALSGAIGQAVSCEIHDRRPSVCRDFAASFEQGRRERRCDESRAQHGMEPLTAEDWVGVER